MEIVNDIWVNWFEGEENGYNVCAFYEWRKNDFIELLDQVPLVKIDSVLFDGIENNLLDIPQPLLQNVRKRTIICKNNQREIIEYCFIATDGIDCLAVDTLGSAIPIRKSRLIPRQESSILEKTKTMILEDYPQPLPVRKQYHLQSPDPLLMIGLTRRERQLKQLLFLALDQLHTTRNVEEIRYWFTECFPTRYEESRQMDFDQAWQELVDGLSRSWSRKQEAICERMIKGRNHFERIWELEHGPKVQ